MNSKPIHPPVHSRAKDVNELSEEARRKLAFDMLMQDEDEALVKAYSAILGIRADSQAAAIDQAATMQKMESWAPSSDSLFESIEAEPAVSQEPSIFPEDITKETTPSTPEYMAPQFELQLEKELRSSMRAEEYQQQMQSESQRERMGLVFNTYAGPSSVAADNSSVSSNSLISSSINFVSKIRGNSNTLLTQSLSLPTLRRSPTKVAPEIDRNYPLPQKKRKFPRTFFHSDIDFKHRFNNVTLPALVDNGRGSDNEALNSMVLKDALLTMPAKIRREVSKAGMLINEQEKHQSKSPISIPPVSRGEATSRGGSVYSAGGSLILSLPPVGVAPDDRSFAPPPDLDDGNSL